MNRVIILNFVLAFAFALNGVDVRGAPNTVESMKCLKSKNYDLAAFRAQTDTGEIDEDIINNVKVANAAGIGAVDVYIVPCGNCGNPRGQVIKVVNTLKGYKYRKIWITVETAGWDFKDKEKSRKFLREIFDEAPRHGKPVGVCTNLEEWDRIVGRDWRGGSMFPLWLDGGGVFRPFGGWRTWHVKDIQPCRELCDLDCDITYEK
eukprot:TRINITY_DN11242_c0_g2_i1.p2 TRINITY_DN11242_c0_g2~~TRINITY_DN11242_c0_g2_i1.p2  ORF type:complete len:205 (+),score=47.11 TRINITY_DN11242_c0_g2_i1:149-763(+)